MSSLIVLHETADVAPASTFVLGQLWRPPFPGPVQLYRRTASGCDVSNELDVGVFVKVGVCMKLSGHEIIQVLAARCKCKGEAVDKGVDRATCVGNTTLALSNYEGEMKEELVIVVQAEE